MKFKIMPTIVKYKKKTPIIIYQMKFQKDALVAK